MRHAASHSASGPASFASQLPGMPQSTLKTNERLAFVDRAGNAIQSVAYEVKNLKGEAKDSGAQFKMEQTQ